MRIEFFSWQGTLPLYHDFRFKTNPPQLPFRLFSSVRTSAQRALVGGQVKKYLLVEVFKHVK